MTELPLETARDPPPLFDSDMVVSVLIRHDELPSRVAALRGGIRVIMMIRGPQ